MKQGLVWAVEAALVLGKPGTSGRAAHDRSSSSRRGCGRHSSRRTRTASAREWTATRRGCFKTRRRELPRVRLPLLARRRAARARRVAGCAGAEPRRRSRALTEAREIFERLGGAPVARATRRPLRPRVLRYPHDLPELRRRQPARREVLLRVRLAARPDVPERSSGGDRRPLLRRVRGGRRGTARARRAVLRSRNRRPSAASSRCCSPISSASRPRPRAATPRTRASSSRATSTRARRLIELLRRHGREVHRRRRHGGVGHAGRARGRRRASRSRSARPCRGCARCARSTRTSTLARACSPERPRSPSAPRARAWSPATSSTRRRAIQSAAEPGTVLVGDATKRSTEAAIAYEDAGAHALKGKAEPDAALARSSGSRRRAAVRSTRRGARAAVRRARPRAAAGQGALPRLGRGGQGAPRLRRRHRRHRQVAARVGVREVHRRADRERVVAPRPLPRLRRGRRLLGARRDGAHAGADRRGGGDRRRRWPSCARRLESHVPDADERAWLEPRLAHLLGLGEATRRRAPGPLLRLARLLRAARGRGRRACSSSRTSSGPTPGLLDFVDHLLEWSRSHPIFVLALARPEFPSAARRSARATRRRSRSSRCPRRRWRPSWTVSSRAFPTRCVAQILERAEGVPLYAVETVRMLLDRGLLAREGDVYRPTRPIESLAVPETLHALIAARLDGLEPAERSLVQDAAVLGKTFTTQGAGRALGQERGRRSTAAQPARSQGGLLAPGGPALARARPVRLPPGPPEARRLRDALEARAQGAAPRRRRLPGDGLGRRAGGRRGRRLALPRRVPAGTGRRRRRRDQAAGARGAHPRRRAGGVARRDRRGREGVRGRGRPRRRAARGSILARTGRPRSLQRRRLRSGEERARTCAGAVRRGRRDR